MPVEYFLRYKGQCYDVGTKLKFRLVSGGDIVEGTIEWISHNHIYIRLADGGGRQLSKLFGLDNTITEIIEPVYYVEPPRQKTRGGPLPPEDDIFYGWIVYIAVMLIGTIFKERFAIWVFASLIFFLWKKGFLSGGKK